jgi:UDP-N-acetylmuramoylalanine--D-glutamate ligase
MSCVRHLVARGQPVAVVDSRTAPPAFEELLSDYPDVPVTLGGFETEWFSNAAQIVLSPGVSPSEPAVRFARDNGIPVLGDIELFARKALAPVAAVTGSNGKSTVTTLVGEMARLGGHDVRVGGNLGPPALSLLDGDPPDLYVVELSSFQLELTRSLNPVAATVLNVSPDHMDRHQDFDHYVTAKRRIFAGSGAMVVNLDDPVVAGMREANRKCIGFTLEIPSANDFGVVQRQGEAWLARGEELLVRAADLPLPGLHNVSNTLAALAMGEALGIAMPARLEGIRRFRGLPYRCQLIAERDGVCWYNDSKGTNVGATVAAIRGLGASRKLVIIAGGDGKGADFAPLRKPIESCARHVVLFGRDAPRIEHAISGAAPHSYANDLGAAIRAAAGAAQPRDAVLFSPACASFDMFENYEARGRAFTAAVEEFLGS